MRRSEREKIASLRAKKAELEQKQIATLLELEIDEISKAEADAIIKIDKELERRLNSPKRKTAIERLCENAELAKQAVKLRTAGKIAKTKKRAGVTA